MIGFADSKNGVRIRLTKERWTHIEEENAELADLREEILATVPAPVRILEGSMGEFLAVREIAPGKWLVVVYRELKADGFIVTAFLTRRIQSLERRRQIWPPLK